MVNVSQSFPPKSLLDLIPIEDYENSTQDAATSFHDPEEIVMSHQYLSSEIQKFGLDLNNCINCSPLIKHLIDLRSLYETISENKI